MGLLIGVFLPLGLAFIMFSLGVGLTGADFRRVLQRPLAFLIGAFHQVLLLPVATFGVIMLFGIRGEMAVGMMILSACPGGVTSNVISKFARADVALSVSLTAVISLFSVVTVPFVIAFAMGRFVGDAAPAINITATAMTMFALTVVPILLGVGLRAAAPEVIARIEPAVSALAAGLFALIVAAALAANWALFVENVAVLGPALIALLAVLTAIGFYVPRALGRSNAEAKTISVETGIQNSTLGIAVAAIIVGADAGFTAYSLPSAVYGIVMYLIVVPVLLVYRRMD